MRNDAQVLICGAGPTGLALALWLSKFGVPLRIIDRLEAPAPYSRALGLQARTLELYRQIDGLADDVVSRGLKVAGANFWTSGRKAAHVEFGDIGAGLSDFPYVLTFAQDKHERLLIDYLARVGVEVERSTELVRFEQLGDRVRATLRRGGVEEVCEAAYLAGCDGAHSAVREGIGATFEGGTYSRLFYVADVDASGPAVDRDIHIELDEADLLAIFPMDGERQIRLVGTIRDDERAKEATFDDVSTRAIERLQLRVEKVNWFSTYRVHHRVAGRFRDRRAFLLGDAAHIHSPVGAQGMNTGIGDAINLAWKLADVLQGRAGDELLDTYEIERAEFARRLVNTTDRVFTIASKPGPIAAFVRKRVVPWLIPLIWRLPPARRFLFRTVSQIEINYRSSPISSGKAGRVHGGDRLPLGTASPQWQELTFDDTPEVKRAGLEPGARYLVRPDSYVAVATSRTSRPRRSSDRTTATRG